MSKLFFRNTIMVAVALFGIQYGFAQKNFELTNPSLKVSGTSSLHDWEMPSTIATGKMTAHEEGNSLIKIDALTIEMPAESIKSGKKAMDKKAYEALKTDKNKTVKFNLKSASKSGDVWNLVGTFTIAGVTKSATVKAKETSSGGVYNLIGEYGFKLTDFSMVPPTAMMGAVKTGDLVKISFNVKFK